MLCAVFTSRTPLELTQGRTGAEDERQTRIRRDPSDQTVLTSRTAGSAIPDPDLKRTGMGPDGSMCATAASKICDSYLAKPRGKDMCDKFDVIG